MGEKINLLENLTDQQLKKLENIPVEKLKEHFNNPLYSKTRDVWEKAQFNQILKGAKKYPETFNPRSWDNDELFNHAVEESIDQMHYIVGMKQRIDELTNQIAMERVCFNILEDVVLAHDNAGEILREYHEVREKLEIETKVDAIKTSYDLMVSKFDFTEKEKSVLKLMLQGLSGKEMADKLFYSHGKLNYISNNVYTKVGIESDYVQARIEFMGYVINMLDRYIENGCERNEFL